MVIDSLPLNSVYQHFVSSAEGLYGDWTKDSSAKVPHLLC